MSESKTYVVGANAFYNRDLIKQLQECMLFRVSAQHYRSNWRMLHIDGFEYEPLPASNRHEIRWATKVGLTTCDGVTGTNVGEMQ